MDLSLLLNQQMDQEPFRSIGSQNTRHQTNLAEPHTVLLVSRPDLQLQIYLTEIICQNLQLNRAVSLTTSPLACQLKPPNPKP